MAVEEGEIAWFSPDPRGIIPLDSFHIPHGLRRSLRKNSFEVRVNTALEAVLPAFGVRAGTWVMPESTGSRFNSHGPCFVHSLETCPENQVLCCLFGVWAFGSF